MEDTGERVTTWSHITKARPKMLNASAVASLGAWSASTLSGIVKDGHNSQSVPPFEHPFHLAPINRLTLTVSWTDVSNTQRQSWGTVWLNMPAEWQPLYLHTGCPMSTFHLAVPGAVWPPWDPST